MNTIAVIPARGGSKGIPRKNLRPVAGKPLLYYCIKACLAASGIDRVVVSTDDEEISLFAERFGANVLLRPEDLADDAATIDPVIVHAVRQTEEQLQVSYSLVVTVQPTSPLISAGDINDAIRLMQELNVDSVISVQDDTHLRWQLQDGAPVPAYSERVNRQLLPKSYRETGAIIACTRDQLNEGTRIGQRVSLLEIPAHRSIDIDSYADLALCEFLMTRRRIVFAVVGNKTVGLGHIYRALCLAHELVQCDLHFVYEESSDLVPEIVRANNYTAHACVTGGLVQACLSLNPDLIINDILDTETAYVSRLKKAGVNVINFEDMGAGSRQADLVINALYPHQSVTGNVLVGAKYFCLRDEFLYLPEVKARVTIERVLLSFGGVDEGNLTVRCLDVLARFCQRKKIAVDVVTGPGYAHRKELRALIDSYPTLNINWADSTRRISDYMLSADIAVTSGGRTVFELTALTVPTLVICQNMRETTHSFASLENGILNLGHRLELTNDEIFTGFSRLVEDSSLRKELRERMASTDLRAGKSRVIELINGIIGSRKK